MIYQIDVKIQDAIYSLKYGIWEGEDANFVDILNNFVQKEDIDAFIHGSISDYNYAIAYLVTQYFSAEIVQVYYDMQDDDEDEDLDYDEVSF